MGMLGYDRPLAVHIWNLYYLHVTGSEVALSHSLTLSTLAHNSPSSNSQQSAFLCP